MSPVELAALSLIVSAAAAAGALVVGSVLEQVSRDPGLRHRIWGVSLVLTAVPPLLIGVALLLPAPVIEVAAPVLIQEAARPETARVVAVSSGASPSPTLLATWLLVLAAVATLVRAGLISWRLIRLNHLIRSAAPAPLSDALRSASARLAVAAPRVRIAPTAPEPLLAGVLRPVLIVPDADTPDAVLAHELAHLKRGDHRALVWEEALAAILAVNPLIPIIRRRRAAAREEATDALALAGADESDRRAYARTLVAALEARAQPTSLPALTFTGTRRTDAMNRLNAVLKPAPAARRTVRLTALGAGVALAALAGWASLALAQQREGRPMVEVENAASQDAQWAHAALQPLYRSVWAEACGFGTDRDARLFVHTGDGCTIEGAPHPQIVSLAGVNPAADARGAFDAVSQACASGDQVSIIYDLAGDRRTATATCSGVPVAPLPPAPVLLTVAADGDFEIRSGDRLDVRLEHVAGDGTRLSKSFAVALTADQGLPDLIDGSMRGPLLPSVGQRDFAITARLLRADGAVVARTGGEASVTVGPEGGEGQLRLVAADPAEAGAVIIPASSDEPPVLDLAASDTLNLMIDGVPLAAGQTPRSRGLDAADVVRVEVASDQVERGSTEMRFAGRPSLNLITTADD